MDKIFEPIKIGNLTIKNRFMMAPMENGMAEIGNGEVTDRLIDFFVARAKHQVGIIITGSIGVSPEGRGLPTQLSLYDKSQVAGHTRLVKAIHEAGALIGAQIYHAGRQASEAITGLTPLAPSAIPCGLLGNHPVEITLKQMQEVKEKFVQAVKWALEANYDLIEVHFAHGYLLHSFMSTHTNKRTDEYGGSFENRIKYPMEVLKAVMDEVKGRCPIQIRVSVDEFVEDGMHFDEVKKLCKICEQAGVNSISLSAGCYDAVEYAIQPMFIEQGFIIPYSKELKKEINIPIIVAARLNNAQMILDIVNNNEADMVAIGRGLIADVELIDKLEKHDFDNIRYCIACNQGCIDRVLGGLPAHCLVNPVAGEEGTRRLKSNNNAINKTIAIIGGGPAGLQAALTAYQRGFMVNLYTNEELGGKLECVATPPEKEAFRLFKDYLINQVKNSNINIINKNVTSADDIEGDLVILATGSTPLVPPIKGIDKVKTLFAEEVLNGKEVTGKVCIIGGGLVGTETAKYLGSKKIPSTIIEMQASVANGIGATFIGHMFKKISEFSIEVKLNAKVLEVTNNKLILENEEIEYDTLILAAGYKSQNKLYDELSKKYEVKVIGDANKPRRILDAVEEAYLTINNL